MPQSTAERKIFLLRADKFLQNITPTISKLLVTTNLQQYKGFLKNITGGEA